MSSALVRNRWVGGLGAVGGPTLPSALVGSRLGAAVGGNSSVSMGGGWKKRQQSAV